MSAPGGLSPELLGEVFPFHLVLGSDLVIRTVGPALARRHPDVAPGRPLDSVVRVVSPPGPLTVESVQGRRRSLYVLEVGAGGLTLRGQMLPDDRTGGLIFLGSPWITELSAIAEQGLSLEDFSAADNLVDYLLLLQTQGSALAQARTLAADLRRSAADLTAQVRHGERLARELESVLNSVGEGIYGVDTAGTITFVNETAALLLGVSREDLLGRKVDEVIHVDDEVADDEEQHLPGSGTSAPLGPVVGRHGRADGTFFDSESLSAPILDDGEVVGSVVVLRDITQRREMDRMKDEFVSVVSHELRTPLTSIRGALGLLGSAFAADIPPSAARMVEVATVSADRLVRLINDILDFERMSAGRLDLDVRPTSARQLLEAATAEMAGLAGARGVRIRLVTAVGTVLADPDRIGQTLSNLLSNAIKASNAGAGVEVRAIEDAAHVRFEVTDTGGGIPADQLDAVFDRFRQVDGSDARGHGGSGLGLAICRGLVERHGGRIWLESRVGAGTTACFTLPRAPGLVPSGQTGA